MLRLRLSTSGLRSVMLLITFGLILASCSSLGNDTDATTTPQVTEPAEIHREAEEGELSVADVLAPVNEAWEATTSERVTTHWGNNLTDAEPSVSPATANQEGIAISISPDSQYLVNNLGEVMMEEVIVVDGLVYARGLRMNEIIAPHADPETWVKIDPTTLPEDEPMRYFLLARIKPAQAPFANLKEETLAQAAEDIGEIEIDGKTCRAYTFAEETFDMGQWTIEVALDEDTNLPCRLVRTMESGYQAVSIFEYGEPGVTLQRPDTWIPASPVGPATPGVGPLGLPSTGPLSTPVPVSSLTTPFLRGQTSIQ